MKKILLTLFLAGGLLSAKSQIIITGTMFDSQGGDAPAVGVAAGTSTYVHKGGYEYMQFMATEDINFATTNFCVVRTTNSGATTGAEPDGWAAQGSVRTFKFNLTSGTVSKGEFFYVGGPEKTAAGFLIDAPTSTYYPALDLSASKWIRTIAYSNGTTNVVGDDGIGLATTGLFVNSKAGSSANPQGVAVFSGTSIDKNSVPIDVIFVGHVNPTPNVTAVYADNGGGNINGYRVPATDHYTAGYFAENTDNAFVFLFQPTDNVGYFLKLSGDYDLDSKTWATPRTGTYVQLVPPSSFGTVAQRTSFATLDMIEGSTAGYNGTPVPVITLPVALTTFTAKANKSGTVNLAWSTASEQNNSHFDVQRATDGTSFDKVGQVTGNGTSNAKNNYSFTDTKPVNGTNYYRLKQVDNDGKSAESKVVSAKVSLNASTLTASVVGNRSVVKVSYEATTAGNATFAIFNTSGVQIATSTQKVSVGINQIEIPATLGNSLHILKVSQAGATSSIKF